MQNYAVARNTPKGPRREGLYDEGYVSLPATHLTDLRCQQSLICSRSSSNSSSNNHLPRLWCPTHRPNCHPSPTETATHHPLHLHRPARPQHPPRTCTHLQAFRPTRGPLLAWTLVTSLLETAQRCPRWSSNVPRRSKRMVRDVSLSLAVGLCTDQAGLDSIGIYRLSGTTSKVQALKNALDKGECTCIGG